MGKTEPRTLPGFMELLPSEQILFDDMKQKIEKSYQKFGFLPIDTPIIEYAEVLLAKAGGETEKQIYRFEKGDTDLALRFDLTVPLAKYVAKNYGNLSFPFRRYQIGKVYRGEKAQKGRYREFYQCDIDIIGDETLDIINDAELPAVIYSTFRTLGFENFTIKINNRKILNGLFEGIGQKDKSVEILRIIDKIDKIGEQAVRKEIAELGVGEKIVNTIIDFIRIDGSADEKIEKLEKMDLYSANIVENESQNTDVGADNMTNATFTKGVNELKEVLKLDKIPRKIEGYDISNLSGQFMVASMCVLKDGELKKNLSRKFKIKTVISQDDPKCMQEVVKRRLLHSIDNPNGAFGDLPDVIFADGGITQIRATKQAIKELGLSIPVYGMVKDDKHSTRALIDENKNEFELSENLMKVNTNFQDNIHDTAINYHRQLRDKQTTHSVLDEIDGIGEAKKKALLKKFKTINNIQNASIEELTEVSGITEKLAKSIKQKLSE